MTPKRPLPKATVPPRRTLPGKPIPAKRRKSVGPGTFATIRAEIDAYLKRAAGTAPRLQADADAHAMRVSRARSLAALMLVGAASLGLSVRAAWLMGVPDERLEARADQFQGSREEHGPRGALYDHHGRLLAYTVSLPALYVNPAALKDDQLADLIPKLAVLTRHSESWLQTHLSKQPDGKKLQELRLADGLDPASVADVTKGFRRDQLWATEEPIRFYPGKSEAAPLLGYVDAQGVGAAGLEKVLEKDVRGEVFRRLQTQDRKGRAVDAGVDDDRVSKAGHSVRLTLDSSIQDAAEVAMMKAVEASRPVAAMAVVMDVHTGAILAMASWPSGNPNDGAALAVQEDFKNHTAMDQIEPGSVMKPFVVAAAIEERLVTPQTMIDCMLGHWELSGKVIKDDHPKGIISVSDVIKFSSNIGAAKMGFMLGAERELAYLSDFGFARSTGLGLPGEVAGSMRKADTIKPIELATTSFGQGITASPVQLAAAVSTIANGGVRMKPYLVDAVLDRFGEVETVRAPQEDRQVISAETARKVTEMMESVTEEGGTGTRARIDGYLVSGKTGTAQKVQNGVYGNDRISSFVGFLPSDRPEIAIAVSIDSPSIGSKYGGMVAAPVFSEIGAFSMRYLGVTPDPSVTFKAPHHDENEPADEPLDLPPPTPIAVKEPTNLPPLEVVGDGQGGWVMPDLAGRTVRAALTGFDGTGLVLDINGSGKVVQQSPGAGASVRAGEKVSLRFD